MGRAKSIPRLLAITPPDPAAHAILAAGSVEALVDAWLRGWARGGGEPGRLAVLLREPGATPDRILDPAGPLAPLRRALADRGVATLLSIDADALADSLAWLRFDRGGAAPCGVQLRGDPDREILARARATLGPDKLLGRSCHGEPPADEAARAALGDYVCLAPIFSPGTRQLGVNKQPIGLEVLARWARVSPRLLALGGVTTDTAGACLGAGAGGLAGISLFFGSIAAGEDNVADLCRLLANARAPGPGEAAHAPPPRR